MQKLFTLFLAFAIAGATRRKDAPQVETRTTPTVSIVEVPQDTIMKVWYRAQKSMAAVPAKQRLTWIQERID